METCEEEETYMTEENEEKQEIASNLSLLSLPFTRALVSRDEANLSLDPRDTAEDINSCIHDEMDRPEQRKPEQEKEEDHEIIEDDEDFEYDSDPANVKDIIEQIETFLDSKIDIDRILSANESPELSQEDKSNERNKMEVCRTLQEDCPTLTDITADVNMYRLAWAVFALFISLLVFNR